MDDRSVRLIPLGGLGEFGMNAMVVEWRDHRVLVDAGVMFPRTDLPGIDMIVPDFDYLANHREGTHGIILTHGHEDHIGALVFALQAASVPVHGTPFTLALAQRRLREHEVSADLRPLTPGTPLDLGPFKVHPIRAAHSIPDCVALAIETPAGIVLSSADFKLRGGASSLEQTDVETFAMWGERGVLALLLDSTNAELPGRTPPEDAVLPAFEEIFDKTRGRVVVTCFATAIQRIERVARIAIAHERQICFLGRRLA